jgi:predicted DNA-binding helix-hairpin-helix protein
MREHRLYQADWLMRYYGFSTEELQAAIPTGHFDLDLDPKTSWALRHREQFPVDTNTATREQLLQVPGLGVRTVDWIVASRKQGNCGTRI